MAQIVLTNDRSVSPVDEEQLAVENTPLFSDAERAELQAQSEKELPEMMLIVRQIEKTRDSLRAELADLQESAERQTCESMLQIADDALGGDNLQPVSCPPATASGPALRNSQNGTGRANCERGMSARNRRGRPPRRYVSIHVSAKEISGREPESW